MEKWIKKKKTKKPMDKDEKQYKINTESKQRHKSCRYDRCLAGLNTVDDLTKY